MIETRERREGNHFRAHWMKKWKRNGISLVEVNCNVIIDVSILLIDTNVRKKVINLFIEEKKEEIIFVQMVNKSVF